MRPSSHAGRRATRCSRTGATGCLNEVLNGLPADKPLGIVAGGHTDVLARALEDAARPNRCGPRAPYLVGRVERPPVHVRGRFRHRLRVRARLDALKGGRSGQRPDLAFARVFTERLLGGFEPRLEVEGLGRAAFVFVSNGPEYSYAGRIPLRFSPKAQFQLGLDARARRGSKGAARLAARLRWAAASLQRHRLHDGTARVLCDRPLPLQADGEDLGDVEEAVFEAERDALAVLVA